MATGTQIEVVMPQMGVSVSEGTITKWLKQPGDAVAQDESLLEISTDKVDTEVPSPGDGVVAEILVGEGQTVDVGTVLAIIAPAGAAVADVAATEAPGGSEPQAHAAPKPAAPEPPRPSPQHPSPQRPSPRRPRRQVAQSRKRLLRPPPEHRLRATGRRSSLPSSPGSRPSTASTRAQFRAPAPAGG